MILSAWKVKMIPRCLSISQAGTTGCGWSSYPPITFLTPFSSSILSPAIVKLEDEFGNDNAVIGSMTVSIYLLGYVVGPIFITPLSETYGRKIVLTASNAIFCPWQIGCALTPNIETLVVSRFFSGVGGAAC